MGNVLSPTHRHCIDGPLRGVLAYLKLERPVQIRSVAIGDVSQLGPFGFGVGPKRRRWPHQLLGYLVENGASCGSEAEASWESRNAERRARRAGRRQDEPTAARRAPGLQMALGRGRNSGPGTRLGGDLPALERRGFAVPSIVPTCQEHHQDSRLFWQSHRAGKSDFSVYLAATFRPALAARQN